MKKGKQGFASMSPERQREIASQGGKVASERGTAHRWNAREAQLAGRIGGSRVQALRTPEERRLFSVKGGKASAEKRRIANAL